MANNLDDAVSRIQEIVNECSSVKFMSYPEYPIENADPFPMSVCFVDNGTFNFTNATIHHNFPVIRLELHFSRINLKQAYQQINALVIELPRRLAGDPTLGGNIETVLATKDQPAAYRVLDFEYGKIKSKMLLFMIPVKTLKSPLT